MSKFRIATTLHFSAVALALFLLATLWIGNFRMVIHEERLTLERWPQTLDGMRIVQLSDVHLPHNPAGIDQIIQKTEKAAPDIILLTGDMVDQSAGEDEAADLERLCSGLAAIAPCYAVSGNHEDWSGLRGQWQDILGKAGVEIVDDRQTVFTKGDASVVLSGLSDASPAERLTDTFREAPPGLPRILLSHRPEKIDAIAELPDNVRPDLVLSGHTHGGQFRIPLTRIGLIAPGQGFFPAWTSGLYLYGDGITLFVSSGVGNSVIPIRLFNPPEIVVLVVNTKK